jgi:hypothetical protein
MSINVKAEKMGTNVRVYVKMTFDDVSVNVERVSNKERRARFVMKNESVQVSSVVPFGMDVCPTFWNLYDLDTKVVFWADLSPDSEAIAKVVNEVKDWYITVNNTCDMLRHKLMGTTEEYKKQCTKAQNIVDLINALNTEN